MPKPIRLVVYLLAVILPIQNWLIGFLVIKLGLPEWVSLWKELLVGILMIYFWLSLSLGWLTKKLVLRFSLTWPWWLIVIITVIASISSFWINQIPINHFLLGFRFELWWLWFFAVASVWWNYFATDQQFLKQLTVAVYVGFALCSALTLASLIWGQTTVSNFGSTKASYNQTANLATNWFKFNDQCHVIDYGLESCRLAGPFSAPNHLAAYLLLVWPIFLVNLGQTWKQRPWKPETLTNASGKWLLVRFIWEILAIVFILSFIALSYARFAWLAVLASLSVLAITYLQQHWLAKTKVITRVTKVGLAVSLTVPLFIAMIAVNLTPEQLDWLPLPAELVKPSSTSLHARHTNASLEILVNNPDKLWFGWGLPVAGPAAKQEYIDHHQNQMIMANSPIAYQHGLLPPDLAVPENWFLQLPLNAGLLYFLAYSWLVCWPLMALWLVWSKWPNINWEVWIQTIFGLSFFGIILGNLLLHLWENQTVAIYWTITWFYYLTLTNLKIDFKT